MEKARKLILACSCNPKPGPSQLLPPSTLPLLLAVLFCRVVCPPWFADNVGIPQLGAKPRPDPVVLPFLSLALWSL